MASKPDSNVEYASPGIRPVALDSRQLIVLLESGTHAWRDCRSTRRGEMDVVVDRELKRVGNIDEPSVPGLI